MLVGHSRNSKFKYHAIDASVLGDPRLLCLPELLPRVRSIREWEPKLDMCQQCMARLDRIDPKWNKPLQHAKQAQAKPMSRAQSILSRITNS